MGPVHGDDQRGLCPGRWAGCGGGGTTAYLDQCLAATLPCGPAVGRAVWCGTGRAERADRGLQNRLALRVDDQLISEGAQLVTDGSRQGDQRGGGILVGLELSRSSVLGQQPGPDLAHRSSAETRSYGEHCLDDRGHGIGVQPRLEPNHLPDHRHPHGHRHLPRADRLGDGRDSGT